MKTLSKRITYIIIGIMIACMTALGVWIFIPSNKQVARAAISDLPEWAPLVAGVYSGDSEYREASGYDSQAHEYTYSTGGGFVNYETAYAEGSGFTPYASGSNVMLHNYIANHNLVKGASLAGIETFYIGVGRVFGSGTQSHYINTIDVQMFLSNSYVHNNCNNENFIYDAQKGVRIAIDDIQEETITFDNGDVSGNFVNKYWFQAIDLSSVYGIASSTGTPPQNGLIIESQGKYTISVQVTYTEGTTSTNINFTYEVNLLSDTEYVQYPMFSSIDNSKSVTEYSKGANSTATEYFNFQTRTLPTLLYKPNRYNVSYIHTHNETHTITTSFETSEGYGYVTEYIDGVESKRVRMELVNGNDYDAVRYCLDGSEEPFAELRLEGDQCVLDLGYIEYTMSNIQDIPLDYYYYMTFEELGNYAFSFSYVLDISNNNYQPMDLPVTNTLKNLYVDSATYGQKELTDAGTYENGMITFDAELHTINSDSDNYDASTDGSLMLRVFGVQSSFYHTTGGDSIKYAMQDVEHGIYADKTSEVNEITAPSVGTEYTNVPSTNLQPVYFDYWGTYHYLGTTPQSKVYKFNRNAYTKDGDTYTITSTAGMTTRDFTKDTTLPIVNIGSMDGLYVVITKYTYTQYTNSSTVHSQIFVVEINNVAPTLTVSAGNNADEMTAITGVTSYTNKSFLSATWSDPNYFQGEIYATIDFFPYETDIQEAIATSANPYQKGAAINVLNNITQEGKYEITLHYGLNSSNTRKETVYVDRTPVQYEIQKVDENYIIGETTNAHLLSDLFTLKHYAKASGAEVTIKYTMVPFGQSNDANVSLTNGNMEGVVISSFINANSTVASIESSFDYTARISDTEVPRSLVFGTYGSALYIITLSDSAGNSNTYFYLYDKTTPGYIFQDLNGDTITLNSMHYINTDTRVFFGTHKVLKLSGELANSYKLSKMGIGGNTWLGSTVVVDNNIEYLFVPLQSSASQEDANTSDKIYVTSEDSSGKVQLALNYVNNNVSYLNIYRKNNPANINTGWKVISGDANLFEATSGERTYEFTLFDILNNYSSDNLQMNFDLAQVSAWISYVDGDSSNRQSVAQTKAYNAKTISFNYEENIVLNENSFGVELSYSYYPFAFSTYLSQTGERDTFPEYSNSSDIYAQEFNRPIPTYPFSRISSKDSVIGKNNVMNEVSNLTAEGMYVIRRIYTGVTKEDFANMENDDKFVRYFVLYVDRYGIISIINQFNADTALSEVNHVLSVGDLIKLTLGAGLGEGTEDHQSIITSDMIVSLKENSLNSFNIFTTNKVKVLFDMTQDKWSTSEKLNNSQYASYTSEDAQTEVNGAIDNNLKYFKLYFNLKRAGSDSIERALDYFVFRNKAVSNGAIDINGNDLNQISLDDEGEYELTIYDLSGQAQASKVDIFGNNAASLLPNYSFNHSITFRFTITHQAPSGKYNTVYDDVEVIDYSTKTTTTPVTFTSTKDEILEFNYSESLDYSMADIDTSYILIQRKAGAINDSGAWSTIFEMNNSTITTPSGASLDNILRKVEIGSTGKYKYIFTIFNGNSEYNLSDPNMDASYMVTIHYLGDESYYDTTNGANYYSNSFAIYVDHKNPEYNLNNLLSADKLYGGQNLDNYYFAVNNGVNSTIFENTQDDNDSVEIFLRELGTSFPSRYYKSVVNGEQDADPERPVFSIFDSNYIKYTYSTSGIFDFGNIYGTVYDKTPLASGYYEVIERDEAGNCTVYLIFVSNNDQREISIDYADVTQNYMHNITLDADVATLRLIELNSIGYILADSSDEMSQDLYQRVIVRADGQIVATYANTPINNPGQQGTINLSLSEWLATLVDSINSVAQNSTTAHLFSLEFINRFGDNYSIYLQYPDNPLELTITTNVEFQTITVVVPATRNGVNLDSLDFKVWNGNTFVNASPLQGSIDKSNQNRERNQTYVFGTGLYKFVTTDNYGRVSTRFAVVNSDNSMEYSFDFGPITYTDSQGVIYTSSDVTLDIDGSLWEVVVVGNSKYYKSYVSQITGRTIYQFSANQINNSEGSDSETDNLEFSVTIRLAISDENDYTTTRFVVSKEVPTASFVDINGNTLNIEPYDNSTIYTFTRNFYINFAPSQFAITASLLNTTTGETIQIDSGHYIDIAGSYILTLANNIGATTQYRFTRENNNFTYYTVKNTRTGQLLNTSSYITIENGRSVHNYFVLESELDNIEVIVDSNEGYFIHEDNDVPGLYSIYKREENIICYVRINYIEESTSFANASMTINGNFTNITTNPKEIDRDALQNRAEKVEIQFNSYFMSPGNLVSVQYYYNNQFVRTLVGDSTKPTMSISFTRAGLHTFRVYDLAGNINYFNGVDHLDVYLLNDVIYTVNNNTPIQNMVFNQAVNISIVTSINKNLYKDNLVEVTATRNGASYTPTVTGNTYRFEESGFYVVRMKATILGTEKTTTYSFMITYDDVAHLSIGIPSSYGFTLQKVLLNNADITSRFNDNSSLWLSVSDTGSGLFTAYMSYYDADTLSSTSFSFKVWINEDNPTIISPDYTFGTKTSKTVTLQYNKSLIYQQIGNAKLVVYKDGQIVYNDTINDSSTDELSTLYINGTKENAGTYYVQIYDAFDRLVVSYKVIKTVPLNSSAKIIIFVASGVVVAGVVLFIILRRHTKFK